VPILQSNITYQTSQAMDHKRKAEEGTVPEISPAAALVTPPRKKKIQTG